MITANDVITSAFKDENAHKELGTVMASCVRAAAQRPGFVRTLMFHMNKMWVSEFTSSEWLSLSRIRRHRRLKGARLNMTDREIIRTLRAGVSK